MVPGRLEEVLSLLRWVRVFLPSRQEVESLMGAGDLWDSAREFAGAGPAVVVIKDGPNGSLVYDRAGDRCWTVPVHVGEVVDVTGAGDAYCGGFLVGYAETDDPLMAACYGTVSASFVLEGHGGLFGLRYTREDAELRLGQVWQKAESVLPGHSSAEKLPRGQLG